MKTASTLLAVVCCLVCFLVGAASPTSTPDSSLADSLRSDSVRADTASVEPDAIMYYFHRTLEDYFSALRQHSFVVTDLREPVPSEEMLANDPGSRPDLKTSTFLVVKAVKTTRFAEQIGGYRR